MMSFSLLFQALDKSLCSPRNAEGSLARHIDSHEWEAAQGTPDYVMLSGRWLLFSSFPDAADLQTLLMWQLSINLDPC